MSVAKRTRGRQSEAGATPSLPPNKKAKTIKDTHQPSSGLSFLTDENKRAGRKLHAALTNGARDAKANRVDESKAVVQGRETDGPAAKEVVDISSGESESSEYESSGDEAEVEAEVEAGDAPKAITNGGDAAAGAQDIAMADADEEDEAGPSFGDLLQASHPETIDVQAAFADRSADAQAVVPGTGSRALSIPSGTSLSTVLTQALRTNDKDLLESCFQTNDNKAIKATIERLHSPLVADLLQRVAERLHKRPGRAGTLIIWIQWSLVAHGGYLASQPQLLKKLKSLSQVVRERANGLQPLLTLKGKLDMLGHQLQLRREMQESRANPFDDDDLDPNVIYVEGEDDESSDEDADDDHLLSSRKQRKITGTSAANGDDMDDLPMTNGATDHFDDDSEGDDDDAEDGLIDDEAEVTDDEEGEDSEEDDDDEEDVSDLEDDESASDDEGPPPVRPPKPQRASGRRR